MKNATATRITLALVFLIGRTVYAELKNTSSRTPPSELVIVNPDGIDGAKVAAWKEEGFTGVVLNLDERYDATTYEAASRAVAAHGIDLYYWIEVGRNPKLANEHPEWMASLGSHDDWRKKFPEVRQLQKGEVAKAWPWTPIAYREAFEAHIARIKELLARIPPAYRGLLLNDLQGGPSSCGCGNLQCRWAIDYGVPATAKKLDGHDVAGRFIAKTESTAPGKQVIPVWTTECEEHDLALEKQSKPAWSTGYCGNVDCLDYCFRRFTEQWNALHQTNRGPIALLALHKEFGRNGAEYGPPVDWIENVVAYVGRKELKSAPSGDVWLVIQGFDVDAEEERAARRAAAQAGADTVVVARIEIDQSYEPRIMNASSEVLSTDSVENGNSRK